MHPISLGVGDSCGLEVGNLPQAGGRTLVDAGVAVIPGDVVAIAGCLNFSTRCDDRDRPDDLDLRVAQFHLADYQGAIAESIELHVLGIDFPGPRNSNEVFGQQMIHGGDVPLDAGVPPLFLHTLDIVAGLPIGMVRSLVLRSEPQGERRGEQDRRAKENPQQSR